VSACWRPLVLNNSGGHLTKIHPETPRSFLYVGVYECADLPSIGPEAQHWVAAQCTHVVQQANWQEQMAGQRMAEKDEEDISVQNAEEELRRKANLLHGHGLINTEIADVLYIDLQSVKDLLHVSSICGGTGRRHTMKWEQPFGFVLYDPRNAVLSLRVMQQAKGDKKEHITDEYTFKICELLEAERFTKCWSQLLPKCGARLKLRLHLRDVGSPSTDMVNFSFND